MPFGFMFASPKFEVAQVSRNVSLDSHILRRGQRMPLRFSVSSLAKWNSREPCKQPALEGSSFSSLAIVSMGNLPKSDLFADSVILWRQV